MYFSLQCVLVADTYCTESRTRQNDIFLSASFAWLKFLKMRLKYIKSVLSHKCISSQFIPLRKFYTHQTNIFLSVELGYFYFVVLNTSNQIFLWSKKIFLISIRFQEIRFFEWKNHSFYKKDLFIFLFFFIYLFYLFILFFIYIFIYIYLFIYIYIYIYIYLFIYIYIYIYIIN